MFRIQDNVPEVYVEESRDFQLFCRLYDCWHGGAKFRIDSIINSLEPIMVSDNYLELLATRVGFFPRIHIDSNVLRYIVAAFPYIIRNKGTEEGVRAAVHAVMKAEVDPRSTEEVIVTFINMQQTADTQIPIYNVSISTKNDIYNKAALREVLRYVLPFGYTYTLTRYGSSSSTGTVVPIKSDVSAIVVKTQRSGVVGSTDGNNLYDNDDTVRNLIGTYNTSVVVGSKDIVSSDNGKFPEEEEKNK